MRELYTTLLLFCLSTNLAAADVGSEIDKLLRRYSTSVDKAKQTLEDTVARDAAFTTKQLIKLAERARKEGDRLAETKAWRETLRLEPSNERATQYFRDLGTLEKETESVAKSKSNLVFQSCVGKWKTLYDNRATANVVIDSDLRIAVGHLAETPKLCDCVATENSVVVKIAHCNSVERWTKAGDRFLVEQWYPADLYSPEKEPTNFGYAKRQ